jgi:poly-gamma-glutamate capsule biosynthesis protein CapA/YwtB (metallophosphatase superfamily)
VPAPGLPSASPSPVVAEQLTLAFAGDVHFVDRTLPLLDDPASAFGPYTETLTKADFAMVNLETAVTERGAEEPKNFHFRSPASAFAAVKAAGIDAVSIANNHTLDYGQIGLLDTLDNAKAAGVPAVGAGRTVAEAYEPYVTTVRGVRIAIVALSQIWELADQWKATPTRPGIAMAFDKTLTVNAVRKARSLADIVVVYLHWGTEDSNCPNPEQTQIAKLLAANGADIVVGTHAHIPLGDGFIGKTYVHYGLGNFLWARSGSKDTGVLLVKVKRTGEVTAREFRIGTVSETGQPVPVTGADAEAIKGRLDQAAKCAHLS